MKIMLRVILFVFLLFTSAGCHEDRHRAISMPSQKATVISSEISNLYASNVQVAILRLAVGNVLYVAYNNEPGDKLKNLIRNLRKGDEILFSGYYSEFSPGRVQLTIREYLFHEIINLRTGERYPQ